MGVWRMHFLYKTFEIFNPVIAILSLRIHITFSIAPAKMKIRLPLFIFTRRKYIHLKRRTNVLSNLGPHKNENERFWRKKLFKHLYGS